jgi:outer membrane protein assembly factor BamB
VTAVDAATGATVWTHPLWQPFDDYSPVARDGVLYLRLSWDGGTLYAIDESDGSIVWTNHALYFGGYPAVDGRDVYLTDGYYCKTGAFDRLTGQMGWLESAGCSLASDWTVIGAGRVLSSNITRDTATGGAVDTAPGGDPAVAGSTSVTVDGSTLRARDIISGRLEWSVPGDDFRGAPLVVNSTVYVGRAGGHVQAYDLQTGASLWSTTLPDGGPQYTGFSNLGMAAGGGLLLVPGAGTLYAFGDQ